MQIDITLRWWLTYVRKEKKCKELAFTDYIKLNPNRLVFRTIHYYLLIIPLSHESLFFIIIPTS